jgi:hypothetical protein
MAVRKHAANPRCTIEIAHPFGEPPSSAAAPDGMTGAQLAVDPRFLAEMLMHAGVQVDAFALRLQFGALGVGRSTRDLAQVAAVLDDFASLDRPLHVSAIGVPSSPLAKDDDPRDPGHWKSPWSPDQQGAWLVPALAIALSKPAVASVCWQDLYDSPAGADMPAGGLISAKGQAKPALARIQTLAAELRAGRSISGLDAPPPPSSRHAEPAAAR